MPPTHSCFLQTEKVQIGGGAIKRPGLFFRFHRPWYRTGQSTLGIAPIEKVQILLNIRYQSSTAKIRQLVVDGRICCCSQFMIFLLELLGPAIGCLAGPSTSNRKIMNWEQQQILPSTTNCLILAVVLMDICHPKFAPTSNYSRENV